MIEKSRFALLNINNMSTVTLNFFVLTFLACSRETPRGDGILKKKVKKVILIVVHCRSESVSDSSDNTSFFSSGINCHLNYVSFLKFLSLSVIFSDLSVLLFSSLIYVSICDLYFFRPVSVSLFLFYLYICL